MRAVQLAGALVLAIASAPATAFDLVFVLPELRPKYQELATATASGIAAQTNSTPSSTIVLFDEVAQLNVPDESKTEYIAIGFKALSATVDAVENGRIYGVVVPYHKAVETIAGAIETIDLRIISAEQPPDRIAKLTKAVLAERNSISVFHSKTNDDRVIQLNRVFKPGPIALKPIDVPENQDVLDVLAEQISDIQALLAVPDPRGVNRHTARHILRSTHRRKIPVIAYSREFVKSGALVAIYSTPEQYGQQLADMIVGAQQRRPAGERSLARPKDFDIAVNERVARTIGLEPQSAEELKARLGADP